MKSYLPNNITDEELEKVKKAANKAKRNISLEKKLLDIIMYILYNKPYTYRQIEAKFNIKKKTINSYVHNEILLSQLFDEWTKEKIKEYIQILDEEEAYQKEMKINMDEYQFYDQFVFYYLNSYYTNDELNQILGGRGVAFQALNSKFFKKNYDPVIQEKIKERSSELKNILRSIKMNKDRVAIRDYNQLKYLTKNSIYVTTYQSKLLNILIGYFKNYGDIKKTIDYFKPKEYSYSYIESSLKSEELIKILNEEAKEKLANFLKMESQLQRPSLVYQNEIIYHALRLFYQYNGNIFKVLESSSLNEEEFIRTLSDKRTKKIVGEKEYDKILLVIDQYEDKKYVIDTLKKERIKTLSKEK